MKKSKTFRKYVAVVLVVLGATGLGLAYRAWRVYRVASDMQSQIRYLIESGETIGEVPASTAFSTAYLQGVFGEDPEVLGQLETAVQREMTETPGLALGEVTAMVVTHRKTKDGAAEDVVAHVLGGFPVGQRKVGFHRDGYFRHLLEPNLWNWGNIILSLLGRDLILLADDEARNVQQTLLESLLSGDILPLANSLEKPIYYTAVFPEPKNVVARQLRPHVETVIMKGHLGMYSAQNEVIILTPSPKSARYTLSVLGDLKTASELALKTKWRGSGEETPWGTIPGPWWANEMALTSENSILERRENVVRIHTDYGRVMVNAVLKAMERMGRDVAQMHGSLEERLDPRIVDARMSTDKPLHYWSNTHEWGPDWPIAPPMETGLVAATETESVSP